MDRLERLFRREQAGRLLSRHFGNGSEYLVQGLRYGVSDPARKPQAESHAQMIKEIILELRKDIGTRGLDKVFNNAEFDRVLVGIDFLYVSKLKLQATIHQIKLMFLGCSKIIRGKFLLQ
jgi:hypothetical protein